MVSCCQQVSALFSWLEHLTALSCCVAVSLSVSQPMDADQAFAALKDARKRMNKLYNQLAKDRPQADPPTSSSGAGLLIQHHSFSKHTLPNP